MIVVFDAQCLLCNGWVQFLLRHDRRSVFQFASIQGQAGQALLKKAGLQVEGLQTLLLVDDHRTWQHTAAILRVLDALGWPWRAAWIGWLVPAPIRDVLYRWIARHRYRLFGRSEVCLMPPPDHQVRFLDRTPNIATAGLFVIVASPGSHVADGIGIDADAPTLCYDCPSSHAFT